jgi:ankyrin repeat protein|tara:strand:- start:421 stop:804 length:384 start_codon:yes stop_codon:yes gene_type:complete
MKHLLLTTIAAVLLVGCGESQPPEPPDISIHEAAMKGNIEAVKQHLAAGTDVNVKDNIGLTPLHMAAGDGRKEVAELLIAKGAEVNVKNKYHKTPLDWAIDFKHPEITNLLRKHGGKTGAELKAEGK